jgi:hypothetical protein
MHPPRPAGNQSALDLMGSLTDCKPSAPVESIPPALAAATLALASQSSA